MPSNSKPILGYWDIRGYGQPIRNLLKYLKIDYEEKFYHSTSNPVSEEWNADKEKLNLAFPNVPYWIDGDLRISESRAIIKYLARENDPSLIPQDNAAWLRADTLDGVISDIWQTLATVCYDPTPENIQQYDTVVPKKLEQVSKYIGNTEWSLGNKISYLDFIVYEVLFHNRAYRPNILDKHANLTQLIRRFEQLPAIAAFIKSPEYITSPCFSAWAKIPL